jgi:hypothetical protein
MASTSGSTIAKPRSDDHDAQALDVEGLDGVLVANGRRGQGAAVAPVRAGHDVEQARAVGDGRRERAGHRGLCVAARVGVGDAAVRALEPDESGEARRGTRRSAAVARRGERHHVRRDRRGRATRRPARRALRVPRVAGDAERGTRGVRERAELGGRGLAEWDRAHGTEPTDVQRVARDRGATEVPARAVGRRHARAVVEVLHAERHARERAGVVARGDASVDRGRGRERAIAVEVHERVQLGVAAPDRVEALRRDVDRARRARANGIGRLDGGTLFSHRSLRRSARE